MSRYLLSALLFFSQIGIYAQIVTFKSIEEARTHFAQNKHLLTQVYACVYLVDTYLDLEKLDSSQCWLTKAFEVYQVTSPSFINYLLQSRQSEIYYYSNLLNLGFESSKKSLQISRLLNDSTCIADANHFKALFLLAQDSSAKSTIYFKEAAKYNKTNEKSEQYLLLIKPYNITNNLAKAYINLTFYDSALAELHKSYNILKDSEPTRGIAVYYYLKGRLHFSQNKVEIALQFYDSALAIAKTIVNLDVELSCYREQALCYKQLNNISRAVMAIKNGFKLFKRSGYINSLFSKEFFKTALDIFNELGNSKGVIDAYAKLSFVDSISTANNASQAQYILASHTNTENRLLKLRIADGLQQQKLSSTRLIILLLSILLLLVFALAMWYFARQKLKVFMLRNTICQSLHDDIGASLSSIHIFGDLATSLWETRPQQSKEMVNKIFVQSKELMETMNDIVWGLKPAENEQNSLSVKLINFSQNFLAVKNIKTHLNIDESLLSHVNNPLIRTNLLLISKETINNIAKHSGATSVSISLYKEANEIVFVISDNGKGFDKTIALNGNGLGNINHRCRQLKGNCVIDTSPGQGVSIVCRFPATIMSRLN